MRSAVLLLVVVAGVVLARWGERDGKPPVGDAAQVQSETPTIVRDVVVRDQSGEIVLEGDVDLSETLARIDRGERLEYRNDGSVFQNRERRLPKQPVGYYREWVHPTPRLSGPGPQRIVTGDGKEAWYTADHYQSFERVR